MKDRLPDKIPFEWISERFLVKCLERKNGGLNKGEMKSFRAEWGKKGVQEVFLSVKFSIFCYLFFLNRVNLVLLRHGIIQGNF